MTYPLIEISTVPIEIEFKSTRGRFESVRGTAEMEMTRDQGGLSIKSRASRINIDTFETRNSIVPTTVRSVEQEASAGKQAAYEATATYARQGQLLLDAKIGEELVTQFAKETIAKDVKTNVGIEFLPSVPPEISFEPGDLSIRYEMDKLNFDWRIEQGEFEFIPGDIVFTIAQKPEVTIKYTGGPIYVPPSSDPNYEPVDVKA